MGCGMGRGTAKMETDLLAADRAFCHVSVSQSRRSERTGFGP